MPAAGWQLWLFGIVCFGVGIFVGRLGSRNKERVENDHVHT
jgi:hypothetical protein